MLNVVRGFLFFALLLTAGIAWGIEAYHNPNNPRAPGYVIVEHAALQTTFPMEKFPKVLVAGRWADQGITATDRCYIPTGVTVLIDTTDAVCDLVRVDGALKFARNVDTRLFVTTIVGPLCSSTLDAGTQADPITAKCEVVFRASAPDPAVDPREFGTGYVGHRTLVWGKQKQTTVDASAPAGATVLALGAAPEGWVVGDQIVLAGTGGKPGEPYRFDTQELVSITSVSGATIGFTPPLKYAHSATFCINLTRNVVFRSENPGYGNTVVPTGSQFTLPDPIVKQRGHVMVMGCGVGASEIGYAEFRDLGRTDKRTRLDAVKFRDGKRLETLNGRPSGTNQVGRYALHFHHGGRTGTSGSVRGCAVSGSPGWGFTNHSSNVRFSDCVGHDCIGAVFSCEIGDEVGLIENCTAIYAKGGHAGRDGVVNSELFDREQGTGGAGFWSQTAGRVRYRNLRTANCNGGFTFWAGPGTQVYSSNPNRNLDNIMGSIDPAEIDPAGPDAYLLKSVDPMTGTINPIRSALDLDGGYFAHSKEGDFLLGPTTVHSYSPNRIRNLKAGAISAQYTLYTIIENSSPDAGPNPLPPYLGAFKFSGGDNSSVILRKCTLKNWGFGVSVPMGLNEVSDCVLESGNNIVVPGASLANISAHPQRPRELWVERTTYKGRLLDFYGLSLQQLAFIMERIVIEGKQIYPPQCEADYVPFPTSVPDSQPLYYVGKTNRQLMDEYGVAVNGDITPAGATLDSKLGFKTGPVSPRKAIILRDGYQNTKIQRASGTIAKLPVEFYQPRVHDPVIVNIEHPVKPGWQSIPVDFDGLRYSVNVFGTGSTPPPKPPPTPPPLVVTSVTVSPASLVLNISQPGEFTAIVKDQFGGTMLGKNVVWSTSDSAVATISNVGQIKVVGPGDCTVTATCEGKQGTANVTVNKPKPKIIKITIELDNGTKVELP